jgi:hypothetical protein
VTVTGDRSGEAGGRGRGAAVCWFVGVPTEKSREFRLCPRRSAAVEWAGMPSPRSEKKEVCGQPTVEARARARDGSRSRWGALAEQGEAGSGFGASAAAPCPASADRALLPLCG